MKHGSLKALLIRVVINISQWLMTSKGTPLLPRHLLAAGWTIEKCASRYFFVEPNIKGRDKVWISFEAHYYRVYHGELRTFVALESTREWLQFYLFSLDKHFECNTRKLFRRKEVPHAS